MPAEFSDPRFPSYGEGREGEHGNAKHVALTVGLESRTALTVGVWSVVALTVVVWSSAALALGVQQLFHLVCAKSMVLATSMLLQHRKDEIAQPKGSAHLGKVLTCKPAKVSTHIPPNIALPAVTRVVSGGYVIAQINVMTKDMELFGYTDGSSRGNANTAQGPALQGLF
eukprot:scaffold26296_cov17-Tisochrysis_lutea.AAC.1